MTATTKKFLFCVLQALAAFWLADHGKIGDTVYMWIAIAVTGIYIVGEISSFEFGTLKLSVSPKEDTKQAGK